MTHMGASELPILAATVTGAIAFAFALVDYRAVGRSSFGLKLVATTIIMGMFTAYHVILLVNPSLPRTTELFGGAVETIIAVVAIGLFAAQYHRNQPGGG